MARNIWSRQELEILTSLYPTEQDNNIILSKLSNRNYSSIKTKANELNLQRRKLTDEERFWTHVNKNSGIFGADGQYPTECWTWTACVREDGYSKFQVQYETVYAHIFSYVNISEQTVPEGFTIDHLCRTRHCIRINHLEAVPHIVNINRGLTSYHNKIKTHCKHGHEFTPENTRIYNGGRYCITCNRIHNRTYKRK